MSRWSPFARRSWKPQSLGGWQVPLIALLFASLRATTDLVWDDTHRLSRRLWDLAETRSFWDILEAQWTSASEGGYRPISTSLQQLGVEYFARDGSIWLWSLIPGICIGLLFWAYRALARDFGLNSRATGIGAILFFASAPFVASSWIIASGIQALVPLILAAELLVLHRFGSHPRVQLGLLAGLFLIAPWVREFTGLGAVLVFIRGWQIQPAESRRFTAIMVLAIVGFFHSLFPGLLVSLFVFGAPTQSVFEIGFLGEQLLRPRALQLEVPLHFLNLLPWSVLAAGLLSLRRVVVRRENPPLLARHLFLLIWAGAALFPFLKVFSEEVHLLYALFPFSLLMGEAMATIRTRSLAGLFLMLGLAHQLSNPLRSWWIVSAMNHFRAELGQGLRDRTEPGARVLSNALHLEELRLAARGQFVSRWTLVAGVPHDFRPQALEGLPRFAVNQEPAVPLYALSVDYEYLPSKRDYHRHPWVDQARDVLLTRDFRVRVISLDFLSWWRPRRFENVLFAPDLENDFYRGPSGGAVHWREVSARYTLWRVR
jgi:hypothetical protein